MHRFLVGTKRKEPEPPTQEGVLANDPLTIITFNANGLAPRLSYNLEELQAMLRTHNPDLVCFQEARLKAHCANKKAKVGDDSRRERHRIHDSELEDKSGLLRKALASSPLCDYDQHWSLADGRAAGTGLFVHKRLLADGGRPSLANDLPAVLAALRGETVPRSHNREGRMIYASFKTFDILNTYVPNRGWTAERCGVRRAWDAAMTSFLTERAKLTDRPLVWCGDLNTVHTPWDSTSEDFFRQEWARDHKDFPTKEAYEAAIDPEDRGIPGFSDGERTRFSEAIAAGGLVDAWRRLNPVPDALPDAASPFVTWRGTLGTQGNFKARYEGMGQRLDYFLCSASLASRIKRCEILGRGTERIGFLGSDHCPVLMELSEAPESSSDTTAKDQKNAAETVSV